MKSTSWSKLVLENEIEIKHGFAFKGEYFTERETRNILLTPGNFKIGGGFKADKLKYYDGPIPDEFVLEPEDLIVTMTDLSKGGDTLGYPAIVPKVKGKIFLHNQRLGKVILKKGSRFDKKYLYYIFCTKEYRSEVLASATGTTVRHTAPDRILNFSISAPNMDFQERIASILFPFDEKIILNEQMNKNLEAIAQRIFRNWFVDFEPFKDELIFNKELNKRIPKGWATVQLKEICRVNMGQSPPSSTYNEEKKGLPFFQGNKDFGFRHPKPSVYCSAPTKIAKPNDILFSVRAPIGDLNVLVEKACIGRGVSALTYKFGSNNFLFYLFKTHQDYWKWVYESEGTVFGCVTKEDIETFELVFPGRDIVKKFNSIVRPLDEMVTVNERESLTLSQIRDTLLPKLLSGEIGVKVGIKEEFPEEIKELEEIKKEKTKIQKALLEWC